MHTGRRWSVVDVDAAEELACLLTGQVWCSCNGFRYAGYLWLNDSTGPDGAQEYAAVREDDHRQVESVTVSWCDEPRGLEIIQEIVAGAGEATASFGSIDSRHIETPDQHGRCWHCA